MKKVKLFLLACTFLLLTMPVCVWGAAGSKSVKGASLPKYKKTVVRTVNPSISGGFSYSLKLLLEEASNKASKDTQYKIIIPPGTYTARYWQIVPSNTWLYAKGATIRALKGKKNMVLLSNQGLAKTENIKIEGGTWDTTPQAFNDSPKTAPFRFAHTKNLIFQDMTIKANRYAHLIEVSDIIGLTVKNCKISGNNYEYGNHVQPKEAIQLDVATHAAMPNMRPYNGKGCHNVIIENNTFTSVARGVGSHNSEVGMEKDPYTNVTVRNNSFKNLTAEAIHIRWWRDCTVEKNTVENCIRAGIYIQEGSRVKVVNNSVKKISSFTGVRRKEYGTATTGIILVLGNYNNITNNVASQFKGKAVDIVRVKSSKGNTIKNNKKK